MDKSGGEYTNLVNRNFNKTRRAVLDTLDIGSLEDDGLSAEGSGAEAALQDYREKLTTADTATEKVTAAYKWTADQLTAGKEEAAQFAVETIVAYQDKQMAEFAAEHAGTADGAAVADADAELKGLAAEEAASRAVDFVLPSPDLGPDGAPKTAEELRDAAETEHHTLRIYLNFGELLGAGGSSRGRPSICAGPRIVAKHLRCSRRSRFRGHAFRRRRPQRPSRSSRRPGPALGVSPRTELRRRDG